MAREAKQSIKFDLVMAHEHVAWTFLMWLLQKLGFDIQWRVLMLESVLFTRFSVLINGGQNELHFWIKGKIHQADCNFK